MFIWCVWMCLCPWRVSLWSWCASLLSEQLIDFLSQKLFVVGKQTIMKNNPNNAPILFCFRQPFVARQHHWTFRRIQKKHATLAVVDLIGVLCFQAIQSCLWTLRSTDSVNGKVLLSSVLNIQWIHNLDDAWGIIYESKRRLIFEDKK